ncbi:MAG: phosphopentomutase [Clostridiales bacterium]|nr:phosphopentomutase [Clostridiales bacterium]
MNRKKEPFREQDIQATFYNKYGESKKVAEPQFDRRVFLVVLDSLGIGRAPDAALFGDEGTNTLASIALSDRFDIPNLTRLGYLSIPGVAEDIGERRGNGKTIALPKEPDGAFGRLTERSNGKDTTVGHWEIAGIVSPVPLPVYPDGFPDEIIGKFEKRIGHKILCNKPYSGTQVIRDYGREHMKTKRPIVYTSADSVFQIAAHEEIIPLQKLYEYCKIARDILTGDHPVGRVIARPFVGEYPNFVRTSNRHDYSVLPPAKTVLDLLSERGWDVISVGKIVDIFAGSGITSSVRTTGNTDGISRLLEMVKGDFSGLCFVNLVDFDSKYGHRNDVDGYAGALAEFDRCLPELLSGLRSDDLLLITADHGCDPGNPSTDHSRETVPLLAAGPRVRPGADIGIRETFADIAMTVADYFGMESKARQCLSGTSFLDSIERERK